ncbi:hypothetical protein Tco_0578963 [Tanacetum coccineum]
MPSPTAQSPDYVPESDPEADPEEDDDEDPEEDPVDYSANGGDNEDDEDEPSEEDEDDDVDIEADEDFYSSSSSYTSWSDARGYQTLRFIYLLPSSPNLPMVSQTFPDTYPSLTTITTLTYLTYFPFSTITTNFILSLPTDAPSLGIPPPLPISVPTSSPPLLLPSVSRREDRSEVTLPLEEVVSLFGPGYNAFETRVRQDTDEIYTRLDDEQSRRQLLAGRHNMLFRDKRAHAYIPHYFIGSDCQRFMVRMLLMQGDSCDFQEIAEGLTRGDHAEMREDQETTLLGTGGAYRDRLPHYWDCRERWREMPTILTIRGVLGQARNLLALSVEFLGHSRGISQSCKEQQKPWKYKLRYRTGADRRFVLQTFSSQMDITPSILDHYYDVELADGDIGQIEKLEPRAVELYASMAGVGYPVMAIYGL